MNSNFCLCSIITLTNFNIFLLGPRCETCSDGYFGNPGKGIACRPCECNNNIDLNAVRNCNQETGECLKCVNNTAGAHCEECLPGK